MRYSVKALHEPNQILQLDIEAADENAARAQAAQQGYVVLTIKAAGLTGSLRMAVA